MTCHAYMDIDLGTKFVRTPFSNLSMERTESPILLLIMRQFCASLSSSRQQNIRVSSWKTELTRPPCRQLYFTHATWQLTTETVLRSCLLSFLHFCSSILKNRFMRSLHKFKKYVVVCRSWW